MYVVDIGSPSWNNGRLLILYLNDVDENSGGHLYATGSHKKGFNSSSIPPTIKFNDSAVVQKFLSQVT